MLNIKNILITVLILFFIYAGYLFKDSLTVPEHIHSRDDNPQSDVRQPEGIDTGQIKELVEQVKNDSNNFSLLMKLGRAYSESVEYVSAVEIFTKAMKLNPQNPEVRVDLGIALRQTGRIKEALELFEAVKKEAPEFGEVWLQLGIIYRFSLKNNQRALEYFQTFLTLEPKSEMTGRVKKEIEQIKGKMKS